MSTVMGLTYRLARTSDIPDVAGVFATAIDELDKKHGFFDSPTPSSPPSPAYAFWLRKDPEAFRVAEDEGKVVGYTFSFLRGTLWFLADLFILPEHQRKGIGGALIRKTLDSWKGRRITNRALITPAFNKASVSLYMKYEMLPRQPVYVASATKEEVARNVGRARGELEVEEAKGSGTLALLNRIHMAAMGFPAGWHNEYFLRTLKSRCLIFRKKGRPEGYSFVRTKGRIGPLVVRSPSLFGPAFDATLRTVIQEDANRVSMLFPGTNGQAARAGIRYGFRIEYPLLFLSTRPMGNFENYLFYSPGLM
jgi:GNAT superfamily N-acetyltransferase